MDEQNLSLIFWQFCRKLGEFVEFFEQNVYVLAAGVENIALFFGDVIELIINRREGKAKDVKLVVFETGVIEIMDIFDLANGPEKIVVALGDVAAVFAEARFKAGFLAVKIVIAETEADGSNLAEASEPGAYAGDFVWLVNGF